MKFLRRHWRAAIGLFANLPAIWASLVHLFDWGARLDLIVAKLHSAGGVNGVLAFLINPPPWFFGAALFVGLLLLYWDKKPWDPFEGKQAVRAPSDAAKARGLEPSRMPPRDVELLDALWRAFTGRWGERKDQMSTADPEAYRFFQICAQVRQHAFDGKLPIWGKRPHSELYEPIPWEYWRNRRIQPNYSMISKVNDILKWTPSVGPRGPVC